MAILYFYLPFLNFWSWTRLNGVERLGGSSLSVADTRICLPPRCDVIRLQLVVLGADGYIWSIAKGLVCKWTNQTVWSNVKHIQSIIYTHIHTYTRIYHIYIRLYNVNNYSLFMTIFAESQLQKISIREPSEHGNRNAW